MGGSEVMQQMKADDTLKHIPVVMMSKEASNEIVENCVNNGAVKFFLGPINHKACKELKSLIETTNQEEILQ